MYIKHETKMLILRGIYHTNTDGVIKQNITVVPAVPGKYIKTN